jgi:hypothetical protein
MKLDSKYHDMVRIRSGKGSRGTAAESKPTRQHPQCQWKGCTKQGPHRAPKGRGRDGEYFAFCSEHVREYKHVREYNKSYNYFNGMSDEEVEDYRKEDVTGHRPTWKVSGNASAEAPEEKKKAARARSPQDFHAWRAKQARKAAKKPSRKLKPLEAKAITTLGLPGTASKDDIKNRFKDLVKKHHPDANGGDRGSEEKLREIIQAYNYLKQVGLV